MEDLGQAQGLRGFTTAQLLHLAAQILQNQIYSVDSQVKVKGGNGAVETKHLLKRNLRNELMALFPGLQLPDTVGTKTVKALVKAGWIQDGRSENAFGPANASGASLDNFRGAIYDFVKDQFAWVAGQRAWPPTRGVPGSGQAPGPSSGSSLDELFSASGYKVNQVDPKTGKMGRKPHNFQERIDAVVALWQVTDRNRAPGAGVRSARGSAFQRSPANADQLDAIVNGPQARNRGIYGGKQFGGINGFVAEKFAHFLATRVTVPLASGTLAAIEQAHTDYVANRGPAIAGRNGSKTEIRDAIEDLGKNPQLLHQNFVRAFQGYSPGQISQYLWNLSGESGINNLLTGYKISKPYNGNFDAAGKPKRGYVHDINAVASSNGDDAVGYSRFVFDTLLAAYIQRGGAGDLNVDKSSKRDTKPPPKGILGVQDKSIQSIGWDTPKGRVALASFIRKAKQNQYSMAALLEGARRMGVQVNENATLHETVIAALREAVIQRLAPLADQGDALAIKAVAAALGINKADVSAADLRRKVDAMYGLKTSQQCDADSYTHEDLKRIAKANGIPLAGLTSTAEACRQLQGVALSQPSNQISGRRKENETQPVAGAGSSSRRREVGGGALIQQLAANQQAQYTPGTMANFGNLLGGGLQQQQQPQPIGGLSGGRLSGSNRAGGTTLSRGNQGAVVGADGRVLSGTRGQPARSGLGNNGSLPPGPGVINSGANGGNPLRNSGGLGGGLPPLPGSNVGNNNNNSVSQSLQDLARNFM
jgi:hypothetical protein